MLAASRGEPREWSLIKCTTCLFSHIVPLPTYEYTFAYYQKKFYTESHPDYAALYEEDREWWTMHHVRTLHTALQLLDYLGPYDNRSVLDIGCGPGLFLDTAKEKGWRTYGIELDRGMATENVRRGHRVSIYSIDNESVMDFVKQPMFHETMDFIEMYEVLEHVINPQKALLAAQAMLRKNGLIHIVVPNDFSPLQLMACSSHKIEPWWISVPEHLNYFTPATLQLLLRRCGFSPVLLMGTFPMEVFLVPCVEVISCRPSHPMVYVGDNTVGRQCHRIRKAWELERYEKGRTHELDYLYTQLMKLFRIGREISVFAVKK